MPSQTPPIPITPLPEEEEDQLLDRLQPSALLARGLQEPAEPKPRAEGAQSELLARLSPEYRIAGELSRGGFGIIYCAEHRKLKRRMALKILSHSLTRDSAAVVRFEREIEAAGKLDHPGIVRAFDAGERSGVWYLAMEFVPGMDFGRLAKTCGPLPPADVAELGRQAALALHYAHSNGLIHRDVKPSNIMLSCPEPCGTASPPTVKILDFGLAQLATGDTAGLTISAEFLGTVEYIAPEQVENPRSADLRSDLYGLGATLYRLLTGRAPHEEPGSQTSLLQKLTNVAHAQAPPVRSQRADVPEGLAAVVDRLLQRDPAARYASSAEVAAALEPFCGSADLTALAQRANADTPAEWPSQEVPPHFFKRIPRLRLRRVAAMLGLAAAIVAGAMLWNREPPSPVIPPPAPAAASAPFPIVEGSGWRLSARWPAPGASSAHYAGSADSILYAEAGKGLRRLDPATGHSDHILRTDTKQIAVTPDGRFVLASVAARQGSIQRVELLPEPNVLPILKCRAAQDDDPAGFAFIPENWKGSTLFRPGDVIVVDSGFQGPDGIWRFRCDSDEPPVQVVEEFSHPVSMSDVAVLRNSVYVINSQETDSKDAGQGRLLRLEGARLVTCRTDQPLGNVCGIAADHSTGGFLVIEGRRASIKQAHRRLVQLSPGAEPDTFNVQVVATHFERPSDGGVDVSADGARVIVSDEDAGEIIEFQRSSSAPGKAQ